MLVEKKSFRRFVLVYIISSLFLLSVGTWLYYKMSYQLILTNNVTHMKQNIDEFIKENKKTRFLKTGVTPNYLDFPIAVYINKKYFNGTFNIEEKYLDKEYFQKNKFFYYIHKEHKQWGEIYFVTYIDVNKDIDTLIFNIFIFFIFSALFIVLIAYVLGKIFLKPMRDTIEALEEFIADATHEINTPISNILTNIELAQELYPTCKEIDEFQKIESSAFRISKIFKDLSFLKLEHKAIKYVQDIQVDEVLMDRLEFFKIFIHNKNLEIDKDINFCKITMDKEDLVRLIDNLLSNAIKYTKNKGIITLELKQEYLQIINDGEIKDEKVVLEKFVRANKNEGGFGLGLYIVEKICTTYAFTFVLSSSNSKVNSRVSF